MVKASLKTIRQRMSVMFWVIATFISIATFGAVIFAAHLLERVAFAEPTRRGGCDHGSDINGQGAGN
jgi:hypothetical protein